MTETKPKSVYAQAASAGLPMGALLCGTAACFLFSLRWPAVSIGVFPLLCCTIVLLYKKMRRLAAAEESYRRVSTLWLFGIYTFVFGSLIAALFSAVVLIFVEPGFIGRYLMESVAQVEASPMAAELAEQTALMRRALDAGILPSESQFVSTMGWLTAFGGSMLSLLMAALVGGRYAAADSEHGFNRNI